MSRGKTETYYNKAYTLCETSHKCKRNNLIIGYCINSAEKNLL